MMLVAALAGALLAAGIVTAVWAFQPAPLTVRRPRKVWGVKARTRVLLMVGGAAGAGIAATTGWLVAIVAIPAGLVMGDRLLRRRTRPVIARLDALAEFARGIAGVLGAGRGIEQAILQASRSTPKAIEPEVAKLAARLRANFDIARALRLFADEFDDATADLFVATLLLASQRRGPGLASVMTDMAASVDAEVRARRAVDAEQQKPRTAARIITAITAALLAGLALSGDYIAPYTTPIGQVLLTAYLTAWALILWWMARMTKDQPIPRFIGTTTTPETGVSS
ncbi:type II secretion system F family protein [Tessaracoccus antarcticus]|uniref:Type II secretion system protein GspF domain-containing protein n=1 Tax=Tessaracoccus antarcticus TaxID=2479848 RepID=A0A3M0G4A1_9ACTN|nr:type II secretion system F family protein [Tessaracoccus antarcticus]RMB57032.1 hypothetical protein EAX62_16155 [Tessaracoccus antarcticus]